MRLYAFLDVTGKLVIHGCVRSARFEIRNHVRDHAPSGLRRFDDRHRTVALLNDNLAALPDFSQHSDDVLDHIGL